MDDYFSCARLRDTAQAAVIVILHNLVAPHTKKFACGLLVTAGCVDTYQAVVFVGAFSVFSAAGGPF